jgi:hypothetical protein
LGIFRKINIFYIMVWDIVLGFLVAILLTLAFFVFAKVLFSQGYKYDKKQGYNQAWALLVFAIFAVALAGLLVTSFFGLGLILKKLAGLILLAFGFFMLVKFPSASDYQPEGFFWLAVVIGLFCTFFGIYLLLF